MIHLADAGGTDGMMTESLVLLVAQPLQKAVDALK